MDVVALTLADCALLSERYTQHNNSWRRMHASLMEAGAHETADRLRALRKLEGAFDVDLGLLCHWYQSRDEDATHPVARAIIRYIVQAQNGSNDRVWVVLDRVRELRALTEEGRLVGEPEL